MSFDIPYGNGAAGIAAQCGEKNGGEGSSSPFEDRGGNSPPAPGAVQVVSLIFCPEVPTGTRYELARRDGNGARRALFSGVLTHAAPSLNLARIRHRGACLGANEVVLVLP